MRFSIQAGRKFGTALHRPSLFCAAYLIDEKGRAVSILTRTLRVTSNNPQFGDVTRFLSSQQAVFALNIDIFDSTSATAGPGTRIGQVVLPISKMPVEKAWLPVVDTKSGSGDAELQFSATVLLPGTQAFQRNMGGSYWIHHSVRMGVFSSSTNLEERKDFMCYELALNGVREAFGDLRYEWNHDYKNAQKIFGKTASAAVIRTTIRSISSSMYRSRLYRTETGHFRQVAYCPCTRV